MGMDQLRGYTLALVLCMALAACSGATSEPGTLSSGGAVGADAPGAGGQQEPPDASGVGGAGGAGGTWVTGGTSSQGGSIASGGVVGQGGLTGTGGPGSGGSAAQGGATGATTVPQVDLTCYSDDDCCVRSDTCRSVVVVYSKIQGLVYWPPATGTGCLRCYTPVVEVSCKNNKCTGTVTNPNASSGTPGVGSHCGKLPGTGGATGSGGATGAGGAAGQAKVTFSALPAPLPLADQPPVFGCGT
jgi:hypothetical protein